MTNPLGYNYSLEDLRKEWNAYSSFAFKQMVNENSSTEEKKFLKTWHSFIMEDLNGIRGKL
jgi:hypothetical protein